MQSEDNNLIHRNLISKSLEELFFEEILNFQSLNGHFTLNLKNVYYQFVGEKVSFDSIYIDNETLIKYDSVGSKLELDASIFFKEIQEYLEIDDIVLSHFLSELQNTLFSDELINNIQENLLLIDLEQFSFSEIDSILNGHPKILLNKGRIGWGASDIRMYSPESLNEFMLRWLLVHKSIATFSSSKELVEKSLKLPSKEYDKDNFLLVPVHPWQWDNKIKLYFTKEIKNNLIVDLGPLGEHYKPQISIRSLSCLDGYDFKTSLSILNTSCYRGISPKFIENGPQISQKVMDLIKQDSFLCNKVEVLRDMFNFHIKNSIFSSIENAPYQFNETFGGVWRESVASKLSSDEQAIPTAALTLKVSDGWYLLDLIKKSKLDHRDWLICYFETVVIPLYHLQTQYGLGLVAHGQNTILVLKDYIPNRLIIKDFHGDLRVSDDSSLADQDGFSTLEKLPNHYLIHDLITGHFITVLRYVARVFHKNTNISQQEFFCMLGKVIYNYEKSIGLDPSESLLMSDEIDKVLVNKVRFKMGYNDTNERLKPLVGKKIKNPLLGQDIGVSVYV